LRDFAEFEKHCNEWINRLGLHEWEISVCQEDLPRDDESVSHRAYMNWTQHKARLVWNSAYRLPIEHTAIPIERRDALHEVLHVLLNPMLQVAASRGDADCKEVDALEHAVINRLLKVMA
jgi:hypothetical protein